MTQAQAKQLAEAFNKIHEGGGSIKIDSHQSADGPDLVAKTSSMDTNSAARLIQDLFSVIVVMESSTIGLQHKPKYKPHINIKLEGDGSYDGSGITWH